MEKQTKTKENPMIIGHKVKKIKYFCQECRTEIKGKNALRKRYCLPCRKTIEGVRQEVASEKISKHVPRKYGHKNIILQDCYPYRELPEWLK